MASQHSTYEFTVSRVSVPLIKKNRNNIRDLFGVDIRLGDVYDEKSQRFGAKKHNKESESSRKQWVTLDGRCVDRNNAKEYIIGLCNPEEGTIIDDQRIVNKVDDEPSIIKRVERDTHAVIIHNKLNKNISVSGSELAVTLALSTLEEIGDDYDDGNLSTTESAASSAPSRLDMTFERVLTENSDGLSSPQDYINTPDAVKRVMIQCLTDSDKTTKLRQFDEDMTNSSSYSQNNPIVPTKLADTFAEDDERSDGNDLEIISETDEDPDIGALDETKEMDVEGVTPTLLGARVDNVLNTPRTITNESEAKTLMDNQIPNNSTRTLTDAITSTNQCITLPTVTDTHNVTNNSPNSQNWPLPASSNSSQGEKAYFKVLAKDFQEEKPHSSLEEIKGRSLVRQELMGKCLIERRKNMDETDSKRKTDEGSNKCDNDAVKDGDSSSTKRKKRKRQSKANSDINHKKEDVEIIDLCESLSESMSTERVIEVMEVQDCIMISDDSDSEETLVMTVWTPDEAKHKSSGCDDSSKRAVNMSDNSKLRQKSNAKENQNSKKDGKTKGNEQKTKDSVSKGSMQKNCVNSPSQPEKKGRFTAEKNSTMPSRTNSDQRAKSKDSSEPSRTNSDQRAKSKDSSENVKKDTKISNSASGSLYSISKQSDDKNKTDSKAENNIAPKKPNPDTNNQPENINILQFLKNAIGIGNKNNGQTNNKQGSTLSNIVDRSPEQANNKHSSTASNSNNSSPVTLPQIRDTGNLEYMASIAGSQEIWPSLPSTPKSYRHMTPTSVLINNAASHATVASSSTVNPASTVASASNVTPSAGASNVASASSSNSEFSSLPPEYLTNTEDRGKNSRFRYIVIDGSNVAMSHGKKVFSCRGISLCVDYFLKRGHKNRIMAWVPHWRKCAPTYNTPITDKHLLEKLERDGYLTFSPSRRVEGRFITPYDDRFVLDLAVAKDGVVVSNDQYQDLYEEKIEYRKIIKERLLNFAWVDDIFMPPIDPLGRHGPNLDEFLMTSQRTNRYRDTPAYEQPYQAPYQGSSHGSYRQPSTSSNRYNRPTIPQKPSSVYNDWNQRGLLPHPDHNNRYNSQALRTQGYNRQALLPLNPTRKHSANDTPPYRTRTDLETSLLRKTLCGLFPDQLEKINRVLNHHPHETNCEKVVNYLLNII